MCEPFHSVTQYDSNQTDDYDNDSGVSNLSIYGRLGHFLKKIKGFFHLSKLGKGHHGSAAKMSSFVSLPDPVAQYEAAWWNRSLRVDMLARVENRPVLGEEEQKLAYDAAFEYANMVSIGSLSSLRRFLEQSIMLTDRPSMYLNYFIQLLNKSGVDKFEKELHRFFGLKLRSLPLNYHFSDENKERIVRLMAGYTRKRQLLVPEWADDSSLWTPGKGVVGNAI